MTGDTSPHHRGSIGSTSLKDPSTNSASIGSGRPGRVEVCALTWPDVSEVGSRIHILRALPKYARLDIDHLEDAPPPKTGETWSIPVRPPLAELLFRQRQRSYTQWPQGWVFPNSRGYHLSYSDWFNRGWHRLLEKSGVKLRVGNAQKALRRTWITSALLD
jgi:integrase